MKASTVTKGASDPRLAKLLSKRPRTGQRVVASIADQQLNRKLEPYYDVLPLWAGAVGSFFALVRPDFVIVQESELERGIWVEAWEDASLISGDLFHIADLSHDKAVTVLTIRDGSGRLAPSLDPIANEHFPNHYFFERSEHGAPRSKLFEIVQAHSLQGLEANAKGSV